MSVDPGLQQYIREIRNAPVLDPDEEQRLARQFLDHFDDDAARRLVSSHMRLVVKVAMQYRLYSVPVEDHISEGAIGLIKAVERFDPDRGSRLSTYWLWWIRASMTDFVIRSWSLVRHLVDTPKTLEALSRRHRASGERIRQIEHEAVAKIKRWIAHDDAIVGH